MVYHDLPALRQALIDLAWEVQFEYNVVISDIICSLSQFQQMQVNRFPYYQTIKNQRKSAEHQRYLRSIEVKLRIAAHDNYNRRSMGIKSI